VLFGLVLILVTSGCLGAQIRGVQEKRLSIEGIITKEKCYGPLGFFSTGGHFFDLIHRPLQFLPDEREKINTTFILHTRKNPINEQIISADDPVSVQSSNFDASKDTKVIVHGLIGHGRKQWIKDMYPEFLKREDWNVLIVDWGNGAGLPYTQATANTRLVGAEIAYLIDVLTKTIGSKPEKFHIIGHSLGAHAAGYAGERLAYLGRITGLDPAGPYFLGTDKAVRLDPTDALFVDVVHSDGGSILNSLLANGGFGYGEPCGHVDIYPNGGKDQPNCDPNIISSILTHGLGEGSKQFVACDHLRVRELYTESINSKSCKFRAIPCSNYEQFKQGQCNKCGYRGCSYLGLDADQNKPAQGQSQIKYFLDTGGEAPYCSYNFVINIQLAAVSHARTEKGKMWIIMQGSNGVTEEIQLNVDSQDFAHGRSFGFASITDFNPGDLNYLQFRWDNDWGLLKPWNWPIFRDVKLYIDKVTIVSGQTMKQVEFCGNGNGIKPEEVRSMPGSQSCS